MDSSGFGTLALGLRVQVCLVFAARRGHAVPV